MTVYFPNGRALPRYQEHVHTNRGPTLTLDELAEKRGVSVGLVKDYAYRYPKGMPSPVLTKDGGLTGRRVYYRARDLIRWFDAIEVKP